MAATRGMERSASEPGLKGRSSLKSAGAAMAASPSTGILALETTNLYDQMQSKNMFRDHAPHIRPAGRSITIPLNDSVERDVRSEVYFAAPPTPINERKYRKLSHGPGEIHVHHGLKDQQLPGEDFRYGIRGVKGTTAESTMKAGLLMGVAEYKNSVAERVYESTKKEPLARAYIRGHTLKMLPEGFGNKSGVPVDVKKVIWPTDVADDDDAMHEQYKKSHNQFHPGERICRRYNMPGETGDPNFRFGVKQVAHAEGVGAKMALNADVEDDGTYKRTRFVQKTAEDFRNVLHPKVMAKVHPKQGPKGPPYPDHHRYGIASTTSEVTAGSCIKGYYNLEDMLPDMDLGKCTKPGRRNFTTESRPFGIPSIRTDIPAPYLGRRSVSDLTNYGDECGAAALLNPQRFDDKGIPDQDFLIRRNREELREIVDRCDYHFDEPYDHVFDEAALLFDDGEPFVSLDALLYVYTHRIENQVSRRLQTLAAPSSALTA